MSGKKTNLTKLYLSGESSKNVLWFPNKTIDLSIFHSQFNFTFWAIDTQFWANSSRKANSDNSQIAYITYNQNILNEFLIPPLALIIFLSVANDSSAVGIAGVSDRTDVDGGRLYFSIITVSGCLTKINTGI